ncbi:PhoH family protein [bacterium]|jgi:phosphate starvation-inducible PhoH-like protein|nr:PhoH family protein [bacterium]
MISREDRIQTADPGEVIVSLAGLDQSTLLGWNDSNLKLLEKRFQGSLTVRGEFMMLRGKGQDASEFSEVVLDLVDMLEQGLTVDEVSVNYVLGKRLDEKEETNSVDPMCDVLFHTIGSRKEVRAKTKGQREYIESIRNNDIVFAVGPAGTGKTYLAVVMAVDYLQKKLVDRIILVRPAVEAGEQLGFLPGDLQDKIDPYLRPLYDALADTVGLSRIQQYMSSGVIEAAPLAFMRGRTLNNAFVILDEAQNTTIGQMKMFLTRLGHQSKAVITGDITQVDLNEKENSGLILVQDVLAETEGVDFVELFQDDVVRHPLVRKIVDAFSKAERSNSIKE